MNKNFTWCIPVMKTAFFIADSVFAYAFSASACAFSASAYAASTYATHHLYI